MGHIAPRGEAKCPGVDEFSSHLGFASVTLRDVNNREDGQAGGRGAFDSRERLPSLLGDGGLVGESPAMRKLGELLTRVAVLEATVLIQGESGTGKDLVARALHRRSARIMGPFIAVNCAALTEALLESELFGHVKGAFTGATADKPGLFEAAAEGTLFLDELGEIPAGMQAKLLRVLQEHAIRPVGGVREKAVDVRVIAATNRDLEAEVRAGRFREDLYYRVNVFTVEVPPLRERAGDVIVLVEHFIEDMCARFNKKVKGIREDALAPLLAHSWPGNVRELSNVMERAVALTRNEFIEVDDLPPNIVRTQRIPTAPVLPSGGIFSDELVPITELEARYIKHVLVQVSGNKTEAARILGIDRRTLHRKLQRLGEPVEDE